MGGSGIAGKIVKTFLDKKCKIPSFIIDGQQVPKLIDSDTLCLGNGRSPKTINRKSPKNHIYKIIN